MNFFAHTENITGDWHKLAQHLNSVGQLAAEFAAQMNPEFAEPARWAGLLHDLGKYREEFQEYLLGKRESSRETQHAIYGAALCFQKDWLAPTFAIAGHHAGLDDAGRLQEKIIGKQTDNTPVDKAGDPLEEIARRFECEVAVIPDQIKEPAFVTSNEHRAEFYIRMLFSALVDADFLDTEEHFAPSERAPQKFKPDELLSLLITEKNSKSPDGELNELRNRIFKECLAAAQLPQGFFTLTVPTGGGKTLSSMAFALAHGAHHKLDRVIVVIPYLSIIEQNASQYRRIFDPECKGIVVEHHSAIEVSDDRESRCRSPLELAAENWDAPIIVTTSVQFIESLFANKPSRCRKLHNIARSVVILDEVQTLPSHLLNPLLNVFHDLRDNYGVSFVFSTATQPAFRLSSLLSEGIARSAVTEITKDTDSVFKQLQRVSFRLPRDSEELGWNVLASQMASHNQVMCVVNTRKQAFELWEELVRNADDRESVFHLSSAMCAQHRSDVLGADRDPEPRTIRERLRSGQPCRVVSTQLVEAGVDLDFPSVYRALGPLDSIVQAAGRCNREGSLQNVDGDKILGEVIVFRPANHALPRGVYRTATDITATILATSEPNRLATDHELFAEYFSRLYQSVPVDYSRARESSIQKDRAHLRFRTVAGKARVITDDGVPVVVPYEKGKVLMAEIANRPLAKGRPRFDRHDLRRLQRYMVNLRKNDFEILLAFGQLEMLLPNLELYVLAEGFYDKHLGVLVKERPSEDFIQ